MPHPQINRWLEQNRELASLRQQSDPTFFTKLAEDHAPELLWIGCSDGRVSPDNLLNLPAGSVFVHRNIGNLFASNDLNCLAVLEYAVDVLRVPDIVVCGHHGCGGIRHALTSSGSAPVDLWTDQIRFAYERFHQHLDDIEDFTSRCNRMAEINVQAQVYNISRSSIVRDAWQHGERLAIHGMCYKIEEGRLFAACESISGEESLQQASRRVIST
ncbi:MAG: carbonic anhydrase [Mariprofundales bacterium]|nr:carbonic anhydrase [Mariprofundales bacterium]